ncbi:hypothetical protein B566_EDAN006284 [Ephemera danica]|nr:hypothetical protein B566_EDAN006284 [Ephemera danica]
MVLILAPTREIAIQVSDVISTIGQGHKGLHVMAVIGGLPIEEDRRKVRGAHILVATPGRLCQLLSEGSLDVSHGEGGECVLLGVRQCAALVQSHSSQLVRFQRKLQALMAILSVVPFKQCIGEGGECVLLGVRQCAALVQSHSSQLVRFQRKLQALMAILSVVPFKQCIVFNNMHGHHLLTGKGWPTQFISGHMEQERRLQAISDLVNIDIPRNAATYLHRVGRAGRFGTKGLVISLCENSGKELQQLVEMSGMIPVDLGYFCLTPSLPVPSDLQDIHLPSLVSYTVLDFGKTPSEILAAMNQENGVSDSTMISSESNHKPDRIDVKEPKIDPKISENTEDSSNSEKKTNASISEKCTDSSISEKTSVSSISSIPSKTIDSPNSKKSTVSSISEKITDSSIPCKTIDTPESEKTTNSLISDNTSPPNIQKVPQKHKDLDSSGDYTEEQSSKLTPEQKEAENKEAVQSIDNLIAQLKRMSAPRKQQEQLERHGMNPRINAKVDSRPQTQAFGLKTKAFSLKAKISDPQIKVSSPKTNLKKDSSTSTKNSSPKSKDSSTKTKQPIVDSNLKTVESSPQTSLKDSGPKIDDSCIKADSNNQNNTTVDSNLKTNDSELDSTSCPNTSLDHANIDIPPVQTIGATFPFEEVLKLSVQFGEQDVESNVDSQKATSNLSPKDAEFIRKREEMHAANPDAPKFFIPSYMLPIQNKEIIRRQEQCYDEKPGFYQPDCYPWSRTRFKKTLRYLMLDAQSRQTPLCDDVMGYNNFEKCLETYVPGPSHSKGCLDRTLNFDIENLLMGIHRMNGQCITKAKRTFVKHGGVVKYLQVMAENGGDEVAVDVAKSFIEFERNPNYVPPPMVTREEWVTGVKPEEGSVESPKVEMKEAESVSSNDSENGETDKNSFKTTEGKIMLKSVEITDNNHTVDTKKCEIQQKSLPFSNKLKNFQSLLKSPQAENGHKTKTRELHASSFTETGQNLETKIKTSPKMCAYSKFGQLQTKTIKSHTEIEQNDFETTDCTGNIKSESENDTFWTSYTENEQNSETEYSETQCELNSEMHNVEESLERSNSGSYESFSSCPMFHPPQVNESKLTPESGFHPPQSGLMFPTSESGHMYPPPQMDASGLSFQYPPFPSLEELNPTTLGLWKQQTKLVTFLNHYGSYMCNMQNPGSILPKQ